MMMQTKPFSVDLFADLADEFSEFVHQRGWKKTRAIAAAIRVFMVLPVTLQVKLMSNQVEDISELLVNGILDGEVQKILSELGPHRAEFLRIAKQTHKKFSQKRQDS